MIRLHTRSTLFPYTTLFRSEYEIIVFDDASTDSTREILAPYEKALPLTVIGSKERVGYAAAVRALLQKASDLDRKSTRLNSSHLGISYAVFCLKKNNRKRKH